jgi:hypothetical protein
MPEASASGGDGRGMPDPLRLRDGTAVGSPEDWERRRAPELRELFQRHVYGFLPPSPADLEARLLHEGDGPGGGRLREIELATSSPAARLRLLLITPPGPGPHPCFVGPNLRGNHTLVGDPGVARPEGTASEPGSAETAWCADLVMSRGYALASFFVGDVVPDQAETAGPRLDALGTSVRRRPGAIAAWAWGLSRCVDHLLRLESIDGGRIAAVGHSRCGKAATVAAAFDERIALLVANGAGSGGTSPFRVPPALSSIGASGRPTVETLASITAAFPHWFDADLAGFAEAPERLPVDQHELIALCAPRPVLLANGAADLWADPEGQFDMLRGADPVYRLLGVEGLEAPGPPPPPALVDSRLGFFIREGGHAMTRTDWTAWLAFADRWL